MLQRDFMAILTLIASIFLVHLQFLLKVSQTIGVGRRHVRKVTNQIIANSKSE